MNFCRKDDQQNRFWYLQQLCTEAIAAKNLYYEHTLNSSLYHSLKGLLPLCTNQYTQRTKICLLYSGTTSHTSCLREAGDNFTYKLHGSVKHFPLTLPRSVLCVTARAAHGPLNTKSEIQHKILLFQLQVTKYHFIPKLKNNHREISQIHFYSSRRSLRKTKPQKIV